MNLENKIQDIDMNFARVYRINHCTAKISPPFLPRRACPENREVAESCTSFNLDQELILDEDGVVDLM